MMKDTLLYYLSGLVHKPSTSSLRHWFYFPDMIATLSFHNVWIMALFHGFKDSDIPDQPTTALKPFPIFYTTILPSFLCFQNDISSADLTKVPAFQEFPFVY